MYFDNKVCLKGKKALPEGDDTVVVNCVPSVDTEAFDDGLNEGLGKRFVALEVAEVVVLVDHAV